MSNLPPLDADRLEELAAKWASNADKVERVSLALGIDGDVGESLHYAQVATEHRETAAVLRALAGAERITDLEINNAGKVWYAASPLDGFVEHQAPTLISALASVAKQEER